MSFLIICPLAKIDAVAERYRPSHMVSLVGTTATVLRPDGIAQENHLFLQINDIAHPQLGLILPEAEHVQPLLDFAKDWVRHPTPMPMLIHCWLGISRSTAAAFIIACALSTQGCEQEIADDLRANAPFATPNARLVALADGLLARQGQMIEAIRRIGRGCDAATGVPFFLAIREKG